MYKYIRSIAKIIWKISLIIPLVFNILYAQEQTTETIFTDIEASELKETLSEDKVVNGSENKKTSALDLYSGISLEYDNNIYRLSDPQRSIYDENDAGDTASGRYDNMNSLSDIILHPVIGIKYKTKSLFGKKLQISSRLKYNFNLENEKSRFPEARINLEQSVFKNGVINLEGNIEYGYFKKNYLSGVEDITDANIVKGERIYSPAVYDEYEGILGYEYRFINKSDDLMITDLSIQPFIGVRYRIYNSTFSNRDQNVVSGGLLLNSEFFSRLGIETSYTYSRITCPGDEEIILFDEDRFGLDVNNDTEFRGNAPLITKIDRSADRHTIEIEPSFKFTSDFRFFLALKIMKTKYKTDNSLDIERYHQKKDYWRIKSGIEYAFSKDSSAEIEFSHTEENDVEDGKYKRNVFIAGFKYYFF